MKPNDKAIEAAREEYNAALIRALRSGLAYNEKNNRAADAIEAVLAERDLARARVEELEDILDGISVYGSDTLSGRVGGPSDKDWYRDGVYEMRNRARNALLARLSPVDDDILREIAARAICLNRAAHACNCKDVGVCKAPVENLREYNEAWPQSSAVIAAIRPHIEAVERERCAKIAEGFSSNRDWVPGSLWGNIRNEIAAAIRRGK